MKNQHVVMFEALVLSLAIAALCVMKAYAGEPVPNSAQYTEKLAPVPYTSAPAKSGQVEWDIDAGARKTWGTGGSANPEADSRYLNGEVYPFQVNNVHIGVAGGVSQWKGETQNRSRYNGQRWVVGPAIKVTGKSQEVDGWVGYGRQDKDSRSHKGVESKSSDGLIGVGVGASFYRREDAGERLFPRTEITGEILVPVDRKNDRTDSIVSVGVREYVYDPSSIPIRTYAGAGLSMEAPTDPKFGLYVGAQDSWGIVSVNAGPRFNMATGATFCTVGANVDVGKAVQLGIRAQRNSQVQKGGSTSHALGVE